MSICSKHQTKDPDCTACNFELDIPEQRSILVTCGNCNFVYYEKSDVCPSCSQDTLTNKY